MDVPIFYVMQRCSKLFVQEVLYPFNNIISYIKIIYIILNPQTSH